MKPLVNTESFRKHYEEKNSSFKKMNITRKRLAIVKDLKRYVESNILKPTNMCYLNIVNGEELIGTTTELVDILGTVKCQVCIKGGLLASVIGYKDNFDATNIEAGYNFESGTKSDSTMKEIAQYWSEFELALMEVAFENSVYTGGYFDADGYRNSSSGIKHYGRFTNAALDFCYDLTTEERMITILNNLITNKGRFVVPGYTLGELEAVIKDNE